MSRTTQAVYSGLDNRLTFDTFVMSLWSSLTGSNLVRRMANGVRDPLTPTWPTQNNPGLGFFFWYSLAAPLGWKMFQHFYLFLNGGMKYDSCSLKRLF